MPYIVKEDREKFEEFIFNVVFDLNTGKEVSVNETINLAETVNSAGEANYVLSSIVWRLFEANPSYTFGNALMACLADTSATLVDRFFCSDLEKDEVYRFIHLFCHSLSGGIVGLRGMLACVGHEFYRRMLGPYEDLAIKRNGDIL